MTSKTNVFYSCRYAFIFFLTLLLILKFLNFCLKLKIKLFGDQTLMFTRNISP